MEQAAQLTDFVAKRPVVLTAGSASAPEWCAKQDRLAALSTDSAHHDIAGAVHEDLFAKQADGARSSQAVPDVVSAVRTKAPLAKWRQRRNRGASRRRPRPSGPRHGGPSDHNGADQPHDSSLQPRGGLVQMPCRRD